MDPEVWLYLALAMGGLEPLADALGLDVLLEFVETTIMPGAEGAASAAETGEPDSTQHDGGL